MIVDSIALSEFEVFSKLDRDLNQKETKLSEFLSWAPHLDSFQSIIADRKNYYTDRQKLIQVLKEQYASIPHSKATDLLIQQLLNTDTYTVCTAHQPALFAGPLFVLSKAISTIKLTKQIKETNPTTTIIPFFVIGSEDHDIEELNHTFIRNEKVMWNTKQTGPAGRLTLHDIQEVLDQYNILLGSSENDTFLKDLMQRAYSDHHTFGHAFQYLIISLLDAHGILVINMDHPLLKTLLAPIITQELKDSYSKPFVVKTQESLATYGYEPASHARDINVFYFDYGYRDRIERENGQFHIVGTDKKFDSSELINQANQHPEKFSPNVILRPLYQEIVLPNLAYVGGGGELAYWLERKSMFQSYGVPFPMLVRRDSFMIVKDEEVTAMNQNNLNIGDLDTRSDVLINDLTTRMSTEALELKNEETEMLKWMDIIKERAIQIDPTLGASVEGEKVKLSKSVEYIEKKMLKAEKQKLEVKLNRAKKLKEKLMPETGLQERKENFSSFYSEYGSKLFSTLLEDFDPLDFKFKMIKI